MMHASGHLDALCCCSCPIFSRYHSPPRRRSETGIDPSETKNRAEFKRARGNRADNESMIDVREVVFSSKRRGDGSQRWPSEIYYFSPLSFP